MTLKVTTEPRDERQLEVKIEVPQERVDQELRKAAAKVSGQYRLPGFRKGKAPYHIVVQQFGLANLYGEFVDKLGEQVYKEALEQEKIEPYAVASLADVSMDPLVFTLVVPLEPTVDLGNYRALRVEAPVIEVDDAAVDERLESLRKERAAWQEVDGPSAYGDMLTIDVKSIIAPAAEGDEPVIVLDETDWDVTPDAENPMDPPGFDAELIGMQKGATKQFVLSWPAESQSIHAGKEATFTIEVKQIQRYESPALDDAFAKLLDPEVESLDAYRAQVADSMKDEQEAVATDTYTAKVLDELVALAELDYPPAVIEDQLDSIVRDYEMQLRRFGLEDLAGFLEQTGQTVEGFRAGMRDQAVLSAERNLVLSEIIRVEQLRVSDEEIDAHIEEMTKGPEEADEETSAQQNAMKEYLHTASARMLIANDIMREKAVERVQAIARGDALPELLPEADAAGAASDEAAVDDAVVDEVAVDETAVDEAKEGAA